MFKPRSPRVSDCLVLRDCFKIPAVCYSSWKTMKAVVSLAKGGSRLCRPVQTIFLYQESGHPTTPNEHFNPANEH